MVEDKLFEEADTNCLEEVGNLEFGDVNFGVEENDLGDENVEGGDMNWVAGDTTFEGEEVNWVEGVSEAEGVGCVTMGENLGRKDANCIGWDENLEGEGEFWVVENWAGGEVGIGVGWNWEREGRIGVGWNWGGEGGIRVGWNWGGEGVDLTKDLGVTADRTGSGFDGF